MIGRDIFAWLAGMQLSATVRFVRVFTAERVVGLVCAVRLIY